MQRGSRKASASSCHRRFGLRFAPDQEVSRSERCSAAFSQLVSPVTGHSFLDEGPHRFGVLRRTRRNDHLLGLVIQ
jgi:hypothetical protein